MNDITVSLADAKAHLSQLTEQAAAGDTIVITKRGKPMVQLTRVAKSRRPVDLERLRRLTRDMPRQVDDAARFVRRMRDDARY